MKGTDAMIRSLTTAGRWAVAALGLLLALCTAPARAQLPSTGHNTVAAVLVVGNRNITTDRIMREIRTRPNLDYSAQRVQDDINRLAATHLFKHLAVRTRNTDDGRVEVIYEVQEHPNIVRDVIFKHAKHLTDDELLTLTRIRKGMPLDKTLNQLAVYEIQDALKKKGRLLASVTLEEGWDESHDRVVFNITEGPVVRVRSTEFTGNEFASSARLRTQLETSRAFLKSIGGDFQPAMIEEDVHKLEDYYRKFGFLNVQVGRELVFSDDFQFVDVTYHIQEGLRFHIKTRTVDGGKSLPVEQVKTIIQLKEGDWYNENVVDKDKESLAAFWGWRGYPVNVQPIVTLVPDEPGVVRVQYQVEERPPVTVGRVIIVGNTVTRDEVIRRALGIYSGQVLRFPELKLDEKALARLGIFEMDPEKGLRPTIVAIPTDDPNVQDILVTVKETHTGSFQIGAGFNTDNGLVGSVVLNERNFDITRFPTSWEDFVEGRAFRGAGQEFRIEAVPGVNLQRYSATWRDPMVFDLPYSLTESVYYREYQYNEYLERRWAPAGPLPSSSRRSGRSRSGCASRISTLRMCRSARRRRTRRWRGTISWWRRALAWSMTRAIRSCATQGGILDISYEQAFGEFIFPIFNVQGSRFFTLAERKDGSGRQVLVLRSQLGIEGANAPVYERFFGGGMQSIRGFEFRGVGPNEGGYMVGGTFMWLNSIEYQIPILANDNLHFVTFVDSGTVESKVGIQDYRVSAGFGFRITIPALGPVPIALDFGFPIVRTQTDITQVFNIWFGMSR